MHVEPLGIRTATLLDRKPAGPEQPFMPRCVGQPPLAVLAAAVESEQRSTSRQQGRRQLDLLRREQPAVTHAAHGLERAHRLAQVQEEASAHDDVEATHGRGVEIVDRQRPPLDARLHHLGEQPEPGALGRAGEGDVTVDVDEARLRVDRPVPQPVILDVDSHDLRRPAALELEGEEAVERADVEAALALHVRPRQAVEDVAEVEPARCGHPRLDIDRVVPELVPDDAARDIGRIRHAHRRCHDGRH